MNHNISLQIHLEYNMRTYTAVCFTFSMTSQLAIIILKNKNWCLLVCSFVLINGTIEAFQIQVPALLPLPVGRTVGRYK